MRNTFIIGGILLVLMLVGGAVYLFFPKAAPVSPTNEDPFGSLGGGTRVPPDMIRLTLSDGSTADVPDFTKDTQPEGASAENGYQVGGNDDDVFQILYYPNDAGFLISLLAEPIGENRLKAEAALRGKLQLPDAELCKLRVEVATSIHVNEAYAGQNLGLSFCAGAVRLP